FSSRRRHTRSYGDWSSDVCSSDLIVAEFITYRIALFVYWLNLLLLGIALYGSWAYASRAGLLKDAVAEDMSRATRRRILVFQLFYAAGFLLSFISTYLAIAVIFLLQLDSAIAPRLGRLWRI